MLYGGDGRTWAPLNCGSCQRLEDGRYGWKQLFVLINHIVRGSCCADICTFIFTTK